MLTGTAALLLLVGAIGVYQFGVPSWMSQALRVSPPTNTLHEALLARLAAYLVADAERQIVAQKYEAESIHKALAISLEKHHTWRTVRWPTTPEAETGALEGCQIFYGKPCALVVTDDKLAAEGDPSRVRDMPRPHYAGTFDLQQIPRARAEFLKRPDVVNYASAPGPKAAAFHPDGFPAFATVTGASTQFDAEEQALEKCNAIPKEAGGLCFVYAVGNQVVLPQRSTRPLTQRGNAPQPSRQAPPNEATVSLHDKLVARLTSLSVSSDEARAAVRDYETRSGHKAIAVAVIARHTWQTFSRPSEDVAITAALEHCQVYYGEPCTLATVDDKIEPTAGYASRDMPRARYAGLFEWGQIPSSEELWRRQDVLSYRYNSGPKAAAYHPWGGGRLFIANGRSQFEAEELALSQCNSDRNRNGRDGECFLYAVGDQVVLPQGSRKPLTARQSESADKKH
jgi:hypothetical protein